MRKKPKTNEEKRGQNDKADRKMNGMYCSGKRREKI